MLHLYILVPFLFFLHIFLGHRFLDAISISLPAFLHMRVFGAVLRAFKAL
jgi:hypothetical protein